MHICETEMSCKVIIPHILWEPGNAAQIDFHFCILITAHFLEKKDKILSRISFLGLSGDMKTLRAGTCCSFQHTPVPP